MTDGRAILGLGVGGAGLRNYGLAPVRPIAAMREAFTVCRGLLAGERVTVEGKVITARDLNLQWTPLHHRIPIYVATHGHQMTRLAGELADGILLANVLVPEALQSYLDLIEEGRARADRPDDAVTVSLRFEACICDDRDVAAEVMRRRVTSRLLSQYPHWEYLDSLGVALPEEFSELAAAKQPSDLTKAMALLPDDVLERTVLFGRPEDVVRQVAGVLRPEVGEITVRPHVVEGQSVEEVLMAFAKAVEPLLTTSSPASRSAAGWDRTLN
jgi:5,10-methylenetetrahydromethanopterin reductase